MNQEARNPSGSALWSGVEQTRISAVSVLLLALLLSACMHRADEPDLSNLSPYRPTSSEGEIIDLAPFLDDVIERSSVPALGAIVVSEDRIIASGFRGLRRRGSEQTVDLDDPVHIGSLGKSMTAVLAAMLVREGRLDWDSSPPDILPEIEANAAWRRSSLERLLRMNAGVDRNAEIEAVFDLWLNARDRSGQGLTQRAELARAALSMAPAYTPGSSLHYSNFSYALAGHMLEVSAGQSFEQLMQERLFAQLGLTRAGFGAPAGDAAVWGHSPDGEPVPPGPEADNPAMLSPAGRVHLTIPEYGAYMQFMLRGANGRSDLLSRADFARLFEPFDAGAERYAMGWEVRDDAGPNVTTLAHTGSNSAWYAYAWMVPERGLGIFAVTNQGGAELLLDAVIWRLVLAEFERRSDQTSISQ